MKLTWRGARHGGRLVLPSGAELVARARHGEVVWRDHALVLSGTLGEEAIELELEHPFRALEHVWIPHLAPEAGDVIGDRVFRAPALLFADGSMALALVPDLDDVGAADGWQTWLDYDHPARRVTLGAGRYRSRGHVFFVKEAVSGNGQSVRLRLHVVTSRRSGDCGNPYRLAARFLWRHWGRPAHARGGCQRAPLARYQEHVAHWAFSPTGWEQTVWQRFRIDQRSAGAPVFIVDATQHPGAPPEQRRWRERRSVWNQAWFSTQRCANGLLRYARQIDSSELADRARAMTEVALGAPQRDGLFPSVLTTGREARGTLECDTPGWDEARWAHSDRRPPSASEAACHLVDAAFTARMLLEWHALTGEPRALAHVHAFAERLVRLQRPSGAFPGWVEPDGRVVPELAESTETAVGATLLLELAAHDSRFRAAAHAALSFLEDPIAAGRWEDFETYYSCSCWGAPELLGRRVPRNGVHKQNTLSIFWCAEALLHAWRVTGVRRWLVLARRCVDELSLYQAVWDPPFLPAPAHGGFGVMNADNEWNDARQSLFAPLYLELYRDTGDVELFERGVAALRASFSLLYCPENAEAAKAYQRRFAAFGPESYGFCVENQGHGDGEPIGDFAIFTWGAGSALAAAATVRDRFGQLFIDTARARALPIDGCSAEVRRGRVHVEDRYDRSELCVVYDDGGRRMANLVRGRGSVPLRHKAR